MSTLNEQVAAREVAVGRVIVVVGWWVRLVAGVLSFSYRVSGLIVGDESPHRHRSQLRDDRRRSADRCRGAHWSQPDSEELDTTEPPT